MTAMTATPWLTETIDISVPTAAGPIKLLLTVQVNAQALQRVNQHARRQERRVTHNLACGNARIPPALQPDDIQLLLDSARLEVGERFSAWYHSVSHNQADFKAWRDGMLAVLVRLQDPTRLKFVGLDRADSLASAEPFAPVASAENQPSP